MSFDPFDYPMGGRQNLMSFNKIENADGTNQSKFLSKRNVSANLDTHDIEGSFPIVFLIFCRCSAQIAWFKISQK